MEAVTETQRTPLNRNYLNISRYKPIKGVQGVRRVRPKLAQVRPSKIFFHCFLESQITQISDLQTVLYVAM